MVNFKNFRSFIHQIALIFQWQFARKFAYVYFKPITGQNNLNAILIVSDPAHLVGARGDEAMLYGALGVLAEAKERWKLYISCGSPNANTLARRWGHESFSVWGGLFMPLSFLRTLSTIRPQAGFVMGADIMDGHYSPVVSLRMLIAADLLALSGASSRFLGFSLNKDVPKLVKFAFRHIDSRVTVNLRDPISLKRHQTIAGKTGKLVADTAFLLKPAESGKIANDALQWIKEQQKIGRLVIGINFHPMLFSKALAKSKITQLATAFANAMANISAFPEVSWILIPHDDREFAGDMAALSELETLLGDQERKNTYHILIPPTAAELKAIAGATDGVITGRMHLAIATLGQGKPVLTLTYQGKFEGLTHHFHLPEWTVIEPELAIDANILTRQILQFIDELPNLTNQVRHELPTVLKLANATFEDL